MNQLSIEIIDSDEKLHELQNEWHLLEDECEDSSIFSSYAYVSTAWKYSKKKHDKLFILLLQNKDKIVGLAPFCISFKRYLGVKARVIRYIAEFEGDKLTLLALDEKAAWERIADFLTNEFHKWDVITLMEQTSSSTIFRHNFSKSSFFYEEIIDSRSYSISLNSGWDSYFSNLSGKTRNNWRRANKKLNEQYASIKIEYIYDSNTIDIALDRFIRLEQMSWKKEAKIGVSKDEVHIQFYRELLNKLSINENAIFIFLKVEDTDVAGNIIYSYKNKLFGRQTTYNPHYSSYSPGVILLSDIIKKYMDEEFYEFDLQGLAPSNGRPKALHTKQWSTSMMETRRQTIYRKYSSRLIPFLIFKQLKLIFIKKSDSE